MWKKPKCNLTSCYAQGEFVQNPHDIPISASCENLHDAWMNYNLCSGQYLVPRYYANPAESHVYINPYYLNYMCPADYGLYGYDNAQVCGYHQILNPTDGSYHYSSPTSSSPSSLNVHECEVPESHDTQKVLGPSLTTYGTISVSLQHDIQVEITIDKAIRLINNANGSIAAMDRTGEICGVIHDSHGRVWQDGTTVHMETGRNMAKIGKRGVVFTNVENSLVYLVDASGTKSTAEKFRNLKYDFSQDIFFKGSVHGREAVSECVSTMGRLFHRSYRRGDQIWTIAGIRIKQSLWGDIRISRDFGRMVVRASPQFGSVSVSTPTIHMSVTSGEERKFFVRRGDKRLTLDTNGFSVRNGTQKAGFDDKGMLVLS